MKTNLLTAALALTVLGTTLASAQRPSERPGGPPPGGPGPSGPGRHGPRPGGPPAGMLLHRKDVRKALGFTAAQKTAFAKLESRRPEPGGPPPDEKIGTLLTATQRKRLSEIQVQFEGALAAHDPKVAASLGLTKAQKAQLAALRPGPPSEGPGNDPRPEGGSRVRDPHQALKAKAERILTAAQRSKLKALGGKPFARDASEDRRPGPPPTR